MVVEVINLIKDKGILKALEEMLQVNDFDRASLFISEVGNLHMLEKKIITDDLWKIYNEYKAYYDKFNNVKEDKCQ